MYPEKNSLSIRLTEPVVSLHSPPERASRRRDVDEISHSPAIVRGLLTLTLAKPTKVSSIELELAARATTHYARGAGPSRTDITEQYKVYSASTVVFKAGPAPQIQHRSTSTVPRVQFRDNSPGSNVRHASRLDIDDARLEASSCSRNASLGRRSSSVNRRLSPDDPAPSYHSLYPLAGQHSFLVGTSYPSAASRSRSVASSSRTTEQPSSPILSQSSLTLGVSCGSAEIRDLPLSRTSSIEEISQDDDEGVDAFPPHPSNVSYYGLSRIATGSSGRSSERGRSHSRLSFGKVVHIFDTVKDRVRSRSPRAGSLHRLDEEEERGRSLMKEKGKTRLNIHGVEDPQPRIEAAVPLAADGANDQSGDGWVLFPEGAYTYPIFFTIPNNSPPTTKADHGSLVWKIKADVKRPSAFKFNMTVQQEVVVVRLPKADDSEEADGIELQQQWDNQFQYRIQIAGRAFPVGGEMPFQLTIMPLEKIKIHSAMVYLDERTGYYTRAEKEARSDAIRRATLLVVKHKNSNERHSEPILPLVSDDPDVFRKSPLHRFLQPGEDESEVASSLMGPGPWTIRHQLKVPDSCSILHPSNRTKGSNVMVNHTLKIILRVEKEEGAVANGRKRLYDIEIVTPVQILSCHCTSEWTSLPQYDKALRSAGDFPDNMPTCPCRALPQAKVQTQTHTTNPFPVSLPRVASLATASSNPPLPSDSLASRNHLHELLMRGLVSERGEAPPSYEPICA